MPKIIKKIVLLSVAALAAPALALAHQPRIVKTSQTIVPEPEISKAYYGKLSGKPDVFIINSDKPFNLYANVLAPDIAGQKIDISAAIFKDGEQIAFLDGQAFEWKRFYEPFGADNYWKGPEYFAQAPAGTYQIQVFSQSNNSKYSLAIGKIERFDFKETTNAFTVIPLLKKDFFEVSPITFMRSPLGLGLIAVTYLLAGAAIILCRVILKIIFKKSPDISINRRLLAIAGTGLLVWAVFTSWNFAILFLSGLALLEAVFSRKKPALND